MRIHPESGRVLGWIVADSLYPTNPSPGLNVLNGIAYKPDADQLLVPAIAIARRVADWPCAQLTGKLWPFVAEVAVLAAPELHGSLELCTKHELSPAGALRAAKLMARRPRLPPA